MYTLSVVVPAYNEQDVLLEFFPPAFQADGFYDLTINEFAGFPRRRTRQVTGRLQMPKSPRFSSPAAQLYPFALVKVLLDAHL